MSAPAGHLERVRLANIAIAEIVPGLTCQPGAIDGERATAWPCLPTEHVAERVRAIRLARMATNGPEYPVSCDVHQVADRPDIWAQCGKVSVASALLGRTCWKAQP